LRHLLFQCNDACRFSRGLFRPNLGLGKEAFRNTLKG
jgi:hypothetical protein